MQLVQSRAFDWNELPPLPPPLFTAAAGKDTGLPWARISHDILVVSKQFVLPAAEMGGDGMGVRGDETSLDGRGYD
jgi:hypothetical protein